MLRYVQESPSMKAPVTQSGQAEARRPARGRREEGVTHPPRYFPFLNESPTSCLPSCEQDMQTGEGKLGKFRTSMDKVHSSMKALHHPCARIYPLRGGHERRGGEGIRG